LAGGSIAKDAKELAKETVDEEASSWLAERVDLCKAAFRALTLQLQPLPVEPGLVKDRLTVGTLVVTELCGVLEVRDGITNSGGT
jgi:hypothetical protein